MKRAIVTPAQLAPGALDELKNWLAITNTQDDISLLALLRASLDLCEAFIRQMPMEAGCEELLAASRDWQGLTTRPVQSVTGADRVMANGSRAPLAPAQYLIDLDADGGARFRLLYPVTEGRVAVRYTAGIASDWSTLPDALRHGIIRLAADDYRQRDAGEARKGPPASVAALWSPWRRMRLT